MTVDEAFAAKRTLTGQLRKIDEAVDTANGDRVAKPNDGTWPWRFTTHEPAEVEVQVDGVWWLAWEAVELTRAGLHATDLALEEAGWL